MENKNSSKKQTKKKSKTAKKIIRFALIVIAIIILMVFLLVPAFVSSEKGRKTILAKINNVVDGQLDFASLSMSWFKGVKLTDISFNDSVGRTSVKIKQIATKPHYRSIFVGILSFGETIIEKPKIEIKLKDAQIAEGPEQKTAGRKKTDAVVLPIKRIDLIINDGELKITDKKSNTIQLSQINSRINLRPPGKRTKFDIAATVIDKGRESKIHADGAIIPAITKNGWSLKGTSSDLAIDVNDLDLESVFALAGVEINAKGRVSAKIKSSSRDNCTKAKIGLDKVEYMGLTFGTTEVDILVQNGILNIAPFSTTANKGILSFAGQADFNAEPPFLKTPGPIHIVKDIRINDETASRLLKYVNPVFAGAVNVSGIANFDCEKLSMPLAGTSKKHLELIGTLSIKNMRLRASDFLGEILAMAGTTAREQIITIHPTRFVAQNGYLRYDNMQMDVGDNPLNFKGIVGLEDNSLDMKVILPYTTRGRTARTGRQTEGRRISLPIKGTIDKPELDVGKAIGDTLIQWGLEELLKK